MGVVIASIIVFFTDYKLSDPMCTFVFAVLVLFTTIPVVKDCILVLMEGAPSNFNTEEFLSKLEKVDGIKEIHDFHVWSLSVGKPALSIHIFSSNPSDTLRKATILCRKYGIYHSTIQVEEWHRKDNLEYIKCEQNIHV